MGSEKHSFRFGTDVSMSVSLDVGLSVSAALRTEIRSRLYENASLPCELLMKESGQNQSKFLLLRSDWDYVTHVEMISRNVSLAEKGRLKRSDSMALGSDGLPDETSKPDSKNDTVKLSSHSGVVCSNTSTERPECEVSGKSHWTPICQNPNSGARYVVDRRVPLVFGYFEFTERAKNEKKNISENDDLQFAAAVGDLVAFAEQHRAVRTVMVMRARPWTFEGGNDLTKDSQRFVRAIARGFVHHQIDVIETHSVKEAACYMTCAIEALLKSKTKKITGFFETRGSICKSVTHAGKGQFFSNWCSMLMEIPGVSEEVAKAIANEFPTVTALTKCAVEWRLTEGQNNPTQDDFAQKN